MPAVLVAAMTVSFGSDAATPGGSTIYGSLWSTGAETPRYGIYEFNEEGVEFKMADPRGPTVGFPMQCGWLNDGKLCGYYTVQRYGTLNALYYIEVDFATGEELRFDRLGEDSGFFLCADYNPDDRCIYGYGVSENSLFAFLKAPASEPGNISIVKEFFDDQDCTSIAYNRQDQKLYGVNGDRDFVTIDMATGNQTVIGEVPFATETLYCGLCYAPKEGLFYWNPQLSNGGAALYTIDPEGMSMTKIYDCPDNEQYAFLMCPDNVSTVASPLQPEIVAVDFADGAVSGSITISLPSKTVGDEVLEGNVGWRAILDGEPFQSGEAPKGTEVRVEYSDLSEGNHVFSFQAYIGDAVSEMVSEPRYIGVDTPVATAYVRLTDKEITWGGVDAGVNGGFIDLDALEYEVCINDEPLVTTSALSVEHNLCEAELKRYTATVTARSRGKVSAPVASNELALGTPLTLDLHMLPTAEDVNRMTVIDVNGDGRTWGYSIYQECAKSSFSSDGPMDDWLILPPVSFPDAETAYRFAADVQICNSSSPDEYLRVCIGTSPSVEAMTTELLETFCPDRELRTYETTFKVPAPGTYYIGLHTTSAYFQEGLLVSNIHLMDAGAAVETADADNAVAPVEYFNLQGISVEEPVSGVYIRRQGSEVRKVFIP